MGILYQEINGKKIEFTQIKDVNQILFIAKNELFQPIGILRLDIVNKEMTTLFVDLNYQKIGIGNILIDNAENAAKQLGLDRLKATTHDENHVMQKILEKRGYFSMKTFEKRL